VFEKINADTLPKHQPYDCTVDSEEGAQFDSFNIEPI